MFGELTTPEQQRVAQAYMPQMGGRSPADVGTMMQQLLSNPDLAAQAMSMYQNASGGNNNSGGTGAGSRIDDLMSGMMAQDGTSTPTAPLPPARPNNLAVQSNNPNNVMPPVKPPMLSGEDRVAKAGGPGGNSANNGLASPTEEGSVDPSMSAIILKTLAALGVGGGAAYGLSKLGRGGKQMPPNIPDGGAEIPNTAKTNAPAIAAQPKVLPPEAGGAVVPVNPAQQRFDQAFLGDIPDAEYRDVTPKKIDTQKKLSGPPDNDDRDKVKKADGKTINAEDETDEAGVRRTVNKATTVKEKIKPKVRVK